MDVHGLSPIQFTFRKRYYVLFAEDNTNSSLIPIEKEKVTHFLLSSYHAYAKNQFGDTIQSHPKRTREAGIYVPEFTNYCDKKGIVR